MAKKKNYVYCRVQCTSAQFNPPALEKKASVTTELRIVSCDKPGLVGRTMTSFMSLSGGATEYTFKSLRALGWTCNDVTELEGVGSIVAAAGIYDDDYKGVTREKIDVFSPRPAVSGDEKERFAREFRAAAAKAKPVAVTAENAAAKTEDLPDQQPDPQPTLEDDCPF